MRVRVDPTKCKGYGLCAQESPAVFELDEWGFATTPNDGVVATTNEDSARRATKLCPESAITIEDDNHV